MRRRLSRFLSTFAEEWGIPIALGVPLAALIIWLGDAGDWLALGLGAAFVGGVGWYVTLGLPRARRAAVAVALAAFAFAWPPAFYLVAERRAPDGWLGAVTRLVAVSPAVAGLVALAAGWSALRARPWRQMAGYGLVAVGLVALLPTAWMSDPWRWVAGGAGFIALLAGSRLAPTPPLGDAEREARRVDLGVTIDGWGVRRPLSGGREESVAWAELTAVQIRTTGGGPFEEDLWWVLAGIDGGALVPGSDPGTAGLLKRLGRLPGFDHAAVIDAMSSVDEADFSCWSGAAGDGVVCADEPTD
jgi:hypothetical protein